ncbi:hypothetical protein E2562_002178 [Oryza meyeriana var. granulata]|uniref:Uncharacterized protein n=1 Tax=Oryza meyeriana var. granulata TaxID=110450 RepID=A0A6G1EE39_9ORYZ|nr:hypothetical protein E2562_002178 [Oryza meyeriana var. granulata]
MAHCSPSARDVLTVALRRIGWWMVCSLPPWPENGQLTAERGPRTAAGGGLAPDQRRRLVAALISLLAPGQRTKKKMERCDVGRPPTLGCTVHE